MKLNLLWVLCIIIFSILIGILIGKLITFPGITVDTKINPLHAISVLSPILIAIVVGILLDKKKESSKIKRDLVLKRVDDLYELLNKLHQEISGNSANLNNINTNLKRIGVLQNCVKNVMNAAGYLCKNHFSEIEKSHKELRTSLTYTEVKSETTTSNEEPDVKVNGEFYQYSNSRIREIELSIDALKYKIFHLQVDISSQ